MIKTASRNIPNYLYGKIGRFEAGRALDVEAEGRARDPRETLKAVLIEAGIDQLKAGTIALDVGYCITIDDEYLTNLGITKARELNKIYREVIRYRLGSLSE